MKNITMLSAILLIFGCGKPDTLPENIHISGQVVDSLSNEGIGHVSVNISESNYNFGVRDLVTVYTDSNGLFSLDFKPQKKLTYTAYFEKRGFLGPHVESLSPLSDSYVFFVKLYK